MQNIFPFLIIIWTVHSLRVVSTGRLNSLYLNHITLLSSHTLQEKSN